MDKIRLVKRPGGVEDIAFDVTGNNVVDKYFGNDRMLEIRRINSSHVPVDSNTALNYSMTRGSVSDVLNGIHDRIMNINENINNVASMTEDRELFFRQNTVVSERNQMIGQQIRNLGGHTLTFKFPESIDITHSDPLVFDGFYNGFLVVDGQNIVLSDSTDIGQLMEFVDCHCHVLVRNITLEHVNSSYGVKTTRCPSVDFSNVAFVGGLSESTGVFYLNSNGVVNSCSVQNDNVARYESSLYDDVKALLNQMQDAIDDFSSYQLMHRHHMFETWFSLSNVAPAGAVVLNGQKIENASVSYPDFWNECISRKSNGSIATCTEEEWMNEVDIHYQLTSDPFFVEGKLYYTKTVVDGVDVYSLAVFTIGGSIEADTYYERVGFGQTGKFVVDEVNNWIRLPKITRFISGCSSSDDFAQGSYDQVNNIKTGFAGVGRPAFQQDATAGPWRWGTKEYNAHGHDGAGPLVKALTFDLSLATRTGDEVRPISVRLWAFMQVM